MTTKRKTIKKADSILVKENTKAYDAPNQKTTPICDLRAGATLKIDKKAGNYYLVYISGSTIKGYVNKKYVEEI